MVVVRSGARREGGGCSGAEGGGAARRLLLLPLCCRCCRRRSAALRRLLRPDLGLPDHRGRQRRSHCLTLPSARIAATASSSSTSSCCCCWRGAGGAGRMRSNPPPPGHGGDVGRNAQAHRAPLPGAGQRAAKGAGARRSAPLERTSAPPRASAETASRRGRHARSRREAPPEPRPRRPPHAGRPLAAPGALVRRGSARRHRGRRERREKRRKEGGDAGGMRWAAARAGVHVRSGWGRYAHACAPPLPSPSARGRAPSPWEPRSKRGRLLSAAAGPCGDAVCGGVITSSRGASRGPGGEICLRVCLGPTIQRRSRPEQPHSLRWPCWPGIGISCTAWGVALGHGGRCLCTATSSWNMTHSSSDVTFRGHRGPVSHIQPTPLEWEHSPRRSLSPSVCQHTCHCNQGKRPLNNPFCPFPPVVEELSAAS